MEKIKDLASRLWKKSGIPLKVASLALPILISSSKLEAFEHTPEQIAKHATEIVTDNEGYKHWKIEGVWYTNRPIIEQEKISNKNNLFSLNPNYPNPFNSSTKIVGNYQDMVSTCCP